MHSEKMCPHHKFHGLGGVISVFSSYQLSGKPSTAIHGKKKMLEKMLCFSRRKKVPRKTCDSWVKEGWQQRSRLAGSKRFQMTHSIWNQVSPQIWRKYSKRQINPNTWELPRITGNNFSFNMDYIDSSIKTVFSWTGAPLPVPAESKQQEGF